jgi:hypothetical protein
VQAAERGAELRLHQALRRAQCLVHRGDDHVGQHLRVVRVDRLRVDLDLLDLASTRRGDGDHPAARGRLDRLVLQFRRRLLHLLLHLADLLHQVVHVEAHRSEISGGGARRGQWGEEVRAAGTAGTERPMCATCGHVAVAARYEAHERGATPSPRKVRRIPLAVHRSGGRSTGLWTRMWMKTADLRQSSRSRASR